MIALQSSAFGRYCSTVSKGSSGGGEKKSFLGFVVSTVGFNNRDLQSPRQCKMFHRMIYWKILTENMQNSEDPKWIFFFRHTLKTTAALRMNL